MWFELSYRQSKWCESDDTEIHTAGPHTENDLLANCFLVLWMIDSRSVDGDRSQNGW